MITTGGPRSTCPRRSLRLSRRLLFRRHASIGRRCSPVQPRIILLWSKLALWLLLIVIIIAIATIVIKRKEIFAADFVLQVSDFALQALQVPLHIAVGHFAGACLLSLRGLLRLPHHHLLLLLAFTAVVIPVNRDHCTGLRLGAGAGAPVAARRADNSFTLR